MTWIFLLFVGCTNMSMTQCDRPTVRVQFATEQECREYEKDHAIPEYQEVVLLDTKGLSSGAFCIPLR
jgi:hypothetical protein